MVSIVVVAYRRRRPLLECLDSCVAGAREIETASELIVVDNDDLFALIRERCPDAQVIRPGFNSGFAGGVSRAIDAARGRWVLLVNDDAVLEPGALRALISAGEHSSSVGSVAGQVRFMRDPERINSAGLSVDRFGIAADRLAGAPIARAQKPGEVFGATGCLALYRRVMLDEIGGFDERFFAYLEDVDVAWRARAAGWSCVYEPGAVAYHHGSASSGDRSPTKYFLVGRNRLWLLARNASTRQLIRALLATVSYDVAYVVYVAATDRTLAPLRGRLAGLRSFRSRRRELSGKRREVTLGRGGWVAALAMYRAYRSFGSID